MNSVYTTINSFFHNNYLSIHSNSAALEYSLELLLTLSVLIFLSFFNLQLWLSLLLYTHHYLFISSLIVLIVLTWGIIQLDSIAFSLL